jgi:orotate phosphoribosyltransferase
MTPDLRERLRSAVVKGPVELPWGGTAELYFDEYQVITAPDSLDACVQEMTHLLDRSRPVDGLAGLATAGVPFTTLLSQRHRLPMFVVRPKPRTYGTATAIEGGGVEGLHLTLIDSVLGTGVATLEAVRLLRAHGAEVTDLIVLLDRERGGRETLAGVGVDVASVTTWANLHADVNG